MNAYLYQNVVFRVFDLLRGRHNIERLKFLRKSQYWPKEKLAEWQLQRLNELLTFAKDHSPFYQQRLKGLKLPFRDIREMETVPVLTKEDIRAHRQEMMSRGVPKAYFLPARTGGSTAEPLEFYQDKRAADWNRGTVYRSQEWAETFLSEPTVQMMGSHYDFTERQKLQWKITLWLQRYKDMPIAVMNDEILEHYYHELMEFRPTGIWGYAGGLYTFARFIKKNHPQADFEYLKALITSSETLLPHMRQEINEAFGGEKVFDHYGSREMYIASECREHRGYHLHKETVLLEIVDKDGRPKGPGELGRVVLTELFNHAFPFIRYEMGDVGVLAEEEDCPCGLSLSKLAKIEGRITDLIVLKDRVLTIGATNVLDDRADVDAYQLIQKAMDSVDVNVVKSPGFTDASHSFITTELRDLMGPDVHISINYVDEIEVPKSGKRRHIISEVAKHHL